jgi:broad specificity phosphatase PhoE
MGQVGGRDARAVIAHGELAGPQAHLDPGAGRAAGFADELAAGLSAGPGRAMGAERAGEIVVVAHGGTFRMLNAYLRGIPVERMRWEPLTNRCILRSPAGWQARLRALIANPDEKE